MCFLMMNFYLCDIIVFLMHKNNLVNCQFAITEILPLFKNNDIIIFNQAKAPHGHL